MANEKETPASNLVSVDPQQLAQLIASTVAQLSTPKAGLDLESLGQTIGEAVAAGMAANAPIKKVTIGEYVRKGGHSPFHPKSAAETPKLRRQCFQNDSFMMESTLLDEEIRLLNKITHSGRYIDRKVEVVVTADGPDEVIYIRFNNRTADQRMDLKGYVKDFVDMLQQIVSAQAAENAEKASKQEAKTQRHFGDTKAFREAKAKAEAEVTE